MTGTEVIIESHSFQYVFIVITITIYRLLKLVPRIFSAFLLELIDDFFDAFAIYTEENNQLDEASQKIWDFSTKTEKLFFFDHYLLLVRAMKPYQLYFLS